jgi:hypothetical protein
VDCLTDYIGLVGCSDSEPESGLYINDLPGVTLESIAKIGNAEQETYLGTWNEIQKRGRKKFATRISAKLLERYKIRSITESVNLLRYIDTVNNQTALGLNWRGFTIELAPKSTQHFVSSAFQRIFIKELSLYFKQVSGSPVALKVFDLDSGEVLGTYEITDPVIGWNTVSVNTSFNHYRLFAAFDATLVASVWQEISEFSINSFCDCVCSIYGDCDARIRGAKSATLDATLTDDDLTFDQNTYGLTGIFTIGCSYENLVCNNRQVFDTSLWYLMGVELMLERLYSDRLNRYTTVDLKTASELKDYFQAEFDKEMEIAVGGINLDSADCCIECNAPIMVVESIP